MEPNNPYDPPNAWQANAFNSQFQNTANQEEYAASPFGENPMQSFLGNFFPPPNTLQYSDSNGDSFMHNGDFQPEAGIFNGATFGQNEETNPSPPFSPALYNKPQVVTPIPPRPPTDYNARAVELKAELVKRLKNRAASATPTILGTIATAKQAARPEGFSSLRGSPKTPSTTSEKRDQELSVNDLISQYSESRPAANARVRQEELPKENTILKSQQNSTNSEVAAKSQTVSSLGSPTRVTKPNLSAKQSSLKAIIMERRYPGNSSLSGASDGEILEETAPPAATSTPSANNLKEPQNITKLIRNDEARRPSQDEQVTKPSPLQVRDESPVRRLSTSSKAQSSRPRDAPHDDFDQRSEKRPHQQEYMSDLKQVPSYRDSRDEEHRRSEHNVNHSRTEINKPIHESTHPTLHEILPFDDDLREWLDITGYHNVPYRSKILNRRRAIAALDAQRAKLVAEMEAEERGGIAPPVIGQKPVSSMLPPPSSNKTETQTTRAESDSQHNHSVSNKRPYGDDQREGPNPGKMARLEDRVPLSRVKDEDDYDLRRPRSRGNEIVHRPFDSRDDRDLSRGRYDSRARSRERDISPGRHVYESRSLPRGRSYDEPFSERDEFQERDKRPFEVHGAYKGRAFDPNFRGAARGRGRGRGRSGSRERDRDFQRDPDTKSEYSALGSRIANGRPYRDPKGFDRGGKGDTRYFIVKSFNEENVLRCMQDSVWTTQKQNGDVFREAFENCKNVILVFSINKSRAFQGYARMESIPGSVDVPEWQHAINWESAGAFKVKWLAICSTRFHRIGHLKNALNENQAVLIGKDGQEIEQNCGAGLTELIDEEAQQALATWRESDDMWDEDY